ncbi:MULTISPECIES: hypothetical protein [Cupriavidus]
MDAVSMAGSTCAPGQGRHGKTRAAPGEKNGDAKNAVKNGRRNSGSWKQRIVEKKKAGSIAASGFPEFAGGA